MGEQTPQQPSYEQLQERLAALETLIAEWILPLAEQFHQDAQAYQKPLEKLFAMTDEEVADLMSGSSHWEDPPKDQRGKSEQTKLLAWSREYLRAENTVARNLDQGYIRIVNSLKMDPIEALHRHDRGILDIFLKECPSCNVATVEVADGVRLARYCLRCQHTYTVQEIQEELAADMQRMLSFCEGDEQ